MPGENIFVVTSAEHKELVVEQLGIDPPMFWVSLSGGILHPALLMAHSGS